MKIPESAAAPGDNEKKFAIFVITLVFLLGSSSYLLTVRKHLAYPLDNFMDHSSKKNAEFRKEIEKKRPGIILLGNSMLGEGVDPAQFAELSGWSTVKFSRGGSETAFWYVVTKNAITKAKYKPDYLVIFFRDTFLTEPDFRVDGRYKDQIDEFAGAYEPVLDQLAYLQRMPWGEYQLNRYLPIFGKRSLLRERTAGNAKEFLPALLLGTSPADLDRAISDTFDDERMDPELLTQVQLAAESAVVPSDQDFDLRVQSSFLPYILAEAQRADIQLIFVRVKRRRDVQPGAQPPWLVSYIRALDSYLEARQIPLIDFTEDERIKLEDYGNGDHLNKKGRELFTAMLVDALSPYLEK